MIALLLGHESVRTTDIHQHATMALKKRAPRDDGTRAARCSQTLQAASVGAPGQAPHARRWSALAAGRHRSRPGPPNAGPPTPPGRSPGPPDRSNGHPPSNARRSRDPALKLRRELTAGTGLLLRHSLHSGHPFGASPHLVDVRVNHEAPGTGWVKGPPLAYRSRPLKLGAA